MNELLEHASDFALERLNVIGGDINTLPVELQTVVLICSAQGIIDNGGFQYFFESDFPGNPPYANFSSAYRRIGANEPASFIDKAVSFFPFKEPHLSAEMRDLFLNSLEETHELFELGDQVCGDSAVWEKLEQFVREHSTAFEAGC